ncbi:non-ribosomal peptide synthetase modules [Zymobacter palmae]|uniref:Non-ribosomal peptide synthetase modules n=1 Tax=Zymobacter palmae TaxID=33074 RepID=A0A348HFC7_9GAMM|nr:non-ribosomal peptide synthetase modules [Zymobacter palmae]
MPSSHHDLIPLTVAQRGLWFSHYLNPKAQPCVYKVAECVELDGIIQPDLLADALGAVVAETEVLRLIMVPTDNGPAQYFAEEVPDTFRYVDVSDQPSPRDAALAWMQADIDGPFPLADGPLFSHALLKLGDAQWIFYHCYHHMVMDGLAGSLFMRRLANVYSDRVAGRSSSAADFSSVQEVLEAEQEYASSARAGKDRDYWVELLQGHPAPASLVGRQSPCLDVVRQQQYVSEATNRALRALAEKEGKTLPQVLSTLVVGYVHGMTQQEDLLLGMPVMARNGKVMRQFAGMASNGVPLRLAVDGNGSLADNLASVTQGMYGVMRHQRYRTEDIRAALGIRGSNDPLYLTLVNIHPFQYDDIRFGDVPAKVLNLALGPVDDLLITLMDRGESGGIEICLSANAMVHDRASLHWHLRRLNHLLDNAVRCWHTPLSCCDMRLPEERQTVLAWGAIRANHDRALCLHELFEQQAAERPEAVAVCCDGDTVSYGQLNAQANRLAHALVAQGVTPDSRVAIALERGTTLPLAILATLKAGGGYVPLDPHYPQQRLRYILDDSAPEVLITTRDLLPLLGDLDDALTVMLLDDEAWQRQPSDNIAPAALGLTPHHLAYIIYTSGSTGQPKGVMVEHRNVTRLLASTDEAFAFGPDEVWTLFHSYAFDFSVWELWGALAYGGRLVVVPALTARSPDAFYQLLCDQQVTVLNQTPSAFRQLVAALPDGELQHTLKWIVFGGEALDTAALQPWYARNGERTQLVNMYGITETTVHVTFQPLTARDAELHGHSPIGQPLNDLSLYLLDDAGEPVPIGVVGELYVGGAGVTRGYLNRPQLTAERFLPDPFADGDNARMYRTGDVGRWNADGTLDYLGRNDHQVKIRGFRIELGEIAARLAEHAAVREAVVVARDDAQQNKTLVAYVVPVADAPDVAELRLHLAKTLPDYMLPSAVVTIEALPLTANGKLDERALPAPDASALVTQAYEAPQGAIEETLAEIWQTLLGVERVGRHDDFFALGGHSLLAVQLVARMRQAGLEADIRALFDQPTLSALAAATRAYDEVDVPSIGIPEGCSHITPDMLPMVSLDDDAIARIVASVPGGADNVQDIYPLAPLQEGLLYLSMTAEQRDPYVMNVLMAFNERERLDEFMGALDAVIARHDVLRTAVLWEGLPEPVQVVWRQVQMVVEEVRLGDGPAAEVLMAGNPVRMALDTAPLLRARIAYDTVQSRWLMALQYHHIVDDATSLQQLVREAQAHIDGCIDTLPPSYPFRHYVAQTRSSQHVAESKAFFTDMLGSLTTPTLPYGMADVRGDGRDARSASLPLPDALTAALRTLARQRNLNVASVCHLAWARVLSLLSGQQDVVFGTVLVGRMKAGAEHALGMFINTLPVRVELADTSVVQAADTLRARLAELLAHEQAPLSLAQRCSQIAAPAPLFSALLNYRHTTLNPQQGGLTLWDGVEVLSAEENTNYPLVLCIDDDTEHLTLSVKSAPPIEASRVAAYMQTALAALTKALQESPDCAVMSLPVVPEDERFSVLDLGATRANHDRALCLHELFEQQAAERPEAVAVCCDGDTVSYGQLNAQANRLAHALVTQGVTPDSRVAIALERGTSLPLAILATLKAGGSYVPLDPHYPQQRLRYILDDSAPEVLITTRDLLPLLGDLDDALTVMLLDDEAWQRQPSENLAPAALGLTPRHLAYIIYTSGSTGQPKGVMVEHRNVTRLLASTDEAFAFGPDGVWTLFHSYAFDFSVWELWGALAYGGRLVVVPALTARSPDAFYQLLCDQQVTVLNQTPSAFRQLVAALPDGELQHTLKWIVFGGEALDTAALQPWYARNGERTQLVNMYGITETTVHVTFQALTARDAELHGHSPIGQPLNDLSLYLLDDAGEPVPIGVVGELYVGGAGVTRGYLNRPQLTAERFLPDPFADDGGARMYRTGDVGRWNADGTLDYLGRNDHQVKIRGFRIELGEIAARLAEHADVREAVVVARDDAQQNKTLVAYVVPVADAPDVAELRLHLAKTLPDYMLPSAVVTIEALPLTANGKLDERALPVPDASALVTQAYEAPQGAIEETLAEIWQTLLGVERVGRYDDFFALGGHSLLAVQLVSRIQSTLQVALPLGTLFDAPVLQALATALEGQRATVLPPIVAHHSDRAPLSLSQQRLWLLSRMSDAAMVAYTISGDLVLRGELNVEALRQALDVLMVRHACLRTVIVEQGGQPVQIVRDDQLGFPLMQLSAEALPDFMPSFDLSTGPLVKGRLVQLAPQHHVLQIAFHHVIADGWSIGIFLQELGALYRGTLAGQQVTLPVLPIQLGDYALWQREHLSGDVLSHQQQYWEAQLAQVPDCLTLPTDYSRPAVQQFDGGHLNVTFDASLVAALEALSRRHGCTLFMTLLASWSVLMGRLSGQSDIVTGTPIAGRSHQALEPLMGMFINTLALRVTLDDDMDTVALLAQVRATALAAQQHADLPFEQVVEATAPVRDTAYSPLFQTLLALHNTPERSLMLPGLNMELRPSPQIAAHFDLSVELTPIEGALEGAVHYAASLFTRETVERWMSYWRVLLEGMVENEHRSVSALPLMSADERHHMLTWPNQASLMIPSAALLHGLFEAQARQTPDAIAVATAEGHYTYETLNQAANQLAHWLIEQGVVPDSRVAVALERGPDLVVALLAVLKAGGAYVPFDPAYPQARLHFMLQDCAPQAIITASDVLPRLGAFAERVPQAVIDAPQLPWLECSTQDPDPVALGLGAHHLAYVIYTSGSTGQPKGVMVEHRQVINLVYWHNHTFGLSAGQRASCVAGVGFDASAWEIWPPLVTGAQLLIPAPDEARDPERLLAWWQAQPLDVSFLPTPVAELAFARGMTHDTLRVLHVAGDRLVRRPDYPVAFALINNYGPTENTVAATSGVITATDSVLHIGRPIANTRAYLLDVHGAPVPMGVVGELYVGGAQVARGYLHQPELTAERFLPDPFVADEDARMYRTGDLARWRTDGTLEYLGRNDFQVKIRGFRIELGEIEAALMSCGGIEEAAVVSHVHNGIIRLVAYVTATSLDDASPNVLRKALADRLPDYMVPAAYVTLPALPLTANGKVDRRALPEPREDAFPHRAYEAPQGPVEEILAEQWCTLLGVERVGRHDDFFALGGHSLLAVQLISRVRDELHRDLPLALLFAHSELRALAEHLPQADQISLPPILPLSSGNEAPLSLAQQRLWFLSQMDEGAKAAYVISGGLCLEGELNVNALQRALDAIVARQAALRTHIEPRADGPVQVVASACHGFPLARITATEGAELAPFTPSFDLTRGPLACGQLVHFADDHYWLRLALHHVIADGRSVCW